MGIFIRLIVMVVSWGMCCGQSCPVPCDPMDCSPPKLLCPWDFPVKNTGVGCHCLLQGIFLTQGLNLCFLCLLHWPCNGLFTTVPPGKPVDGYIRSQRASSVKNWLSGEAAREALSTTVGWLRLEGKEETGPGEAWHWGFPDGSVVKKPPADAGDAVLIPGPGSSHMPQGN